MMALEMPKGVAFRQRSIVSYNIEAEDPKLRGRELPSFISGLRSNNSSRYLRSRRVCGKQSGFLRKCDSPDV